MIEDVFVVTEDSYSTIDEIVTELLGVYATYDLAVKGIKDFCKEKNYVITNESEMEIDTIFKEDDSWIEWTYEYKINKMKLVQ